MSTSIFREKNLQKVSSPDHLDDYIRVSNPSVWLILGAIVLLLAAAIVWAVFGSITESASGIVVVRDGSATCYVEQARAADLSAGDAVEAAGVRGMATSQAVSLASADVVEGTDGMAVVLWGDAPAVSAADVSIDLPNGVYEATIELKTYEPLALLFGSL